MILSNFCDPSSSEDWIQRPFNLDDITIATDGYFLVSVPKQETDKIILKMAVEMAIKDLFSQAQGQPFKRFPLKLNNCGKPCQECQGLGRVLVEQCPECHGEGNLLLSSKENEYVVFCKTCKGEGQKISPDLNGTTCRSCDGTGNLYPLIEIEKGFFKHKYIDQILNFKNPSIFLNSNKSVLFFKADNGIKGLVVASKAGLVRRDILSVTII